MSRNLPYVRVADTVAFPTQQAVCWFINKTPFIGSDIELGLAVPASNDTLNMMDHQILSNIERLYDLTALRGDTASRPTENLHQYFDTDLGIPIWWNGTNWINASNTIV